MIATCRVFVAKFIAQAVLCGQPVNISRQRAIKLTAAERLAWV